ncbi:MAG: type II toxin-antitoxin system VapC family toxin [Candidatus Kapaibacterium sp.]
MVGVVLDTNAAIAVMKFEPSILRTLQDRDVFLSMMALGELYFGAYNSQRLSKNLSNIDALIRTSTILPMNLETSQVFGQIRTQLKKMARPIPVNDIWIAACAKEHGLQLVMRDGHFRHVSGLETIAW